jgi:hypothetical protein
MQALRDWSFARVVLVSLAWVGGVLLLAALWLWWYFRPTVEPGSGSAGIGAVSFGINVFVLLIPVGPPIALFLIWLVTKWRR